MWVLGQNESYFRIGGNGPTQVGLTYEHFFFSFLLNKFYKDNYCVRYDYRNNIITVVIINI